MSESVLKVLDSSVLDMGSFLCHTDRKLLKLKKNPLHTSWVNKTENCSISDDLVHYFLSAVG